MIGIFYHDRIMLNLDVIESAIAKLTYGDAKRAVDALNEVRDLTETAYEFSKHAEHIWNDCARDIGQAGPRGEGGTDQPSNWETLHARRSVGGALRADPSRNCSQTRWRIFNHACRANSLGNIEREGVGAVSTHSPSVGSSELVQETQLPPPLVGEGPGMGGTVTANEVAK